MGLTRLFVVVIVSVSMTYYFVSGLGDRAVRLGFPVDQSISWLATFWPVSYAFAMTLLGVLLGSLYRRLIELKNKGQRRVKFRTLLKSVLGSIDFQIGLVGAPLLFGLIVRSIGEIGTAGITAIALQNGFAAHALLQQLTESPNEPHGQT